MKPFIKSIGRIHPLSRGLHAALCLCLIIQILYTTLLICGPNYPLPGFLHELIEKALEEQGYHYRAQKASINVELSLSFKNLEILSIGSTHSLITADYIEISPKIFPLFSGTFKPAKITLKGSNYYPLPGTSPQVEKLSLQINQSGPWWEITWARGVILGLPIIAKGFFPKTLLSQNKTAPHNAATLTQIQAYINTLKNPALYLHLSADLKQNVVFSSTLWAHNLQAQKGFVCDDLKIKAIGHITPTGLTFTEPLTLFLKNLTTPQGIQANSLNAYFTIIPDTYQTHLPFSIQSTQASFHGVKGLPVSLDSLELHLLKPQLDHLEGTAILTQGASWTAIDGTINPHTKSGNLQLNGITQPTVLEELIPHIKDLKDFKDLPLLAFRGTLMANPELKDLEGTFSTLSGAGQWKTLAFDYTCFKGHYNKEGLTLDHYKIKGPAGIVRGSATFRLKGPCRIQVYGQADPTILNPYLPEWWADIWPPLNFHTTKPSANLDIHADIQDPAQVRVIGAIEGALFTYRGERIDLFKTHLYAKNHDVTLGPFLIEVAPYNATGKIHWTFDEIHDDPLTTTLSFKGNLPIETLSAFPVARPITENFKCPTPPYLTLSSAHHLLTPAIDRLSLTADCPAPLSYLNIPLDSLHFKANQQGDYLEISPLDFGLAQGKGTGRANISNLLSNNPILSFSLNLTGVRRDLLLERVPYLNSVKKSLPTSAIDPELTPAPGFIDAAFTAQGPLNKPKDLEGHGYFQLREVRTQVKNPSTFGAPQKNTPPTIGSFEIQEIATTFTMSHGYLNLQDARLSGPTTRIIATGSYHIATDALDFRFHIYPFAEVPILSAAFLPLRPFSKVFEMRLGGTLSDPRWGLSHF